MARIPRNVIAVTPGGNITKEMILGFVALFSVPDHPVSKNKLRSLWAAEGLTEGLVPKDRKAVHAFQAACRSVETRRGGANGGSSTRLTEVKVDEVLENENACVYQVTRLVRDQKQQVIEHPKAIRVTFNKDSGKIKHEKLEDEAYEALKSLVGDIRDHFDKNASKVPGSKVRAAIRAELDGMGATPMRKGGGVYFAPRTGHDTLMSIQRVLAGIYSGDEAELSLIPLANAETEREMIERHFTVNVREELNELQADVTNRLREGNGIRSDRLRNIINRRRELEQHAERYRTLLDSDLSVLSERGRLLDEQIEELVTKAGASL